MYFNFQQYLFSIFIPSLQKKKNEITKNFKTK